MTDDDPVAPAPVAITADLSPLKATLAQVPALFTAELVAPAREAADATARAMDGAAGVIVKSLRAAALSGRSGFREMADGILADLSSLALDSFVFKPLDGFLSSILGNIAGGRALGGPVGAGSAWLVGERGPEIFRPRTAGEIVPLAQAGEGMAAPVSISITLGPGSDAESFRRSEGQIAAAIARAVARGQRHL